MIDEFRDRKLPRSETDDDQEPSFIPPENVANQEEVIDMPKEKSKSNSENPNLISSKLTVFKGQFTKLKTWWEKRSKQQKIAIIVGLMVGLLLAVFGLYSVFKSEPKPAPVVQKQEEKKEPPKPTTEPSKLTGVIIPIEQNQLTVTGIMIENSPDARPQAGIKDAGVVFEAIAEGGITRFLTLFQESQPDYIGPVRSVRPYYLQWLQAFDAAVAHAGGSGEALIKIRDEGIKDLDHGANGGAFQRISGRYAPHNLYTSRASLVAAEKSRGYNTSNFTGFARKAEKPITPATARLVDVAISSPLYNTHYDYNAATNSYNRSQGWSSTHVDERSGVQISPKVVIAMVMPQSIHPDRVHTFYQPLGSGTAYIFQDGGVTIGTWTKASDKDQIKFADAGGAPLGLNPGQTWLTAVGAPTNVAYQP